MTLAGGMGHAGGVADRERERLSRTFDQADKLYQRARPDYPPELYERLLSITRLPPAARLLEIGCATGKATLPLARRGFRLTCLEPGPALAAAARANLAGFEVEVIQTRFEDWVPTGQQFALVFAATSWHWVDPDVRYRLAAEALEPGGHLATWGTGHVAITERSTKTSQYRRLPFHLVHGPAWCGRLRTVRRSSGHGWTRTVS